MRATECLRREPKSGWTKRDLTRKKHSRTGEIICLCPFGRKPDMSGAEETVRSTIQQEDIPTTQTKPNPSMKKIYPKTLKKKGMRRRRLIGF